MPPLQSDFFIGLPESEDYRVADMIAPLGEPTQSLAEPSELLKLTLLNPQIEPEVPSFTLGETKITEDLTLVELGHSSTDPDGDPLQYQWWVLDPNSATITLTNPASASPTWSPSARRC